MRTAKLLALILLAFVASVALPTVMTAQTVYYFQPSIGNLSFNFTVNNGSPKDPYNVCVKIIQSANPEGGTPGTCCTTGGCISDSELDNVRILESWRWTGCEQHDIVTFWCLEPGTHTISLNWSPVYLTGGLSYVTVIVDNSYRCDYADTECPSHP